MLIFTDQNLQWRAIKDIHGKEKKSDAFFHLILEELKKNKNTLILGIYPISIEPSLRSFIEGVRVFIDKVRNWDVLHIPFDYFWSINAWYVKMNALRHFKKVWSILERDNKFIEIYGNFKDILKYYFYITFPHIIEYIQISKNIIKTINPKLVLLLNEYGFFERALIAACKLNNIPTIAIQHGISTLWYSQYIHPKNLKTKFILLPDITCVYGKKYFIMMVKNSIYSPRSVIVTGSPRYDILYNASRIYDKNLFLQKFNIPNAKKIVLWTTQCHGVDYVENIKSLKVVLSTFKELEKDNVFLIIKQHPGEKIEHTNLINKYINKYKLKNIILVPKTYDTYELLYVCDILITRHSTTALEAIALNKPVIILNLSGQSDLVEYVKEGVAVGVYDERYFKPILMDLLSESSDLEPKLKINRYIFIRNYLNIDGKSTERVINIIKDLLNKN